MIKGSIQKDCIEILNASALDTRAVIQVKQKLKELKGGMDKSTITVGDVWSAIKLQFFWLAISIYSIIKYFLIHYGLDSGHHGPELKNLTVKYQGLSVTIKIV